MQGQIDMTCAPVVDFNTVRIALAIAVQWNYAIHQMDDFTAFLHGKIDSNVYIIAHEYCTFNLNQGEALQTLGGLYLRKHYPRFWT